MKYIVLPILVILAACTSEQEAPEGGAPGGGVTEVEPDEVSET